ncbi:RING-HC finger protein [Endozoicomonas ascidiicola]|uniref:RING-HC finger protein n=1 Tax=Endozoicomonas ascidiicola TaxID=1698521 RepID=UPI000BA3DE38|nr:RING-HC finger protein [Endozoicomonas ascidiicola]
MNHQTVIQDRLSVVNRHDDFAAEDCDLRRRNPWPRLCNDWPMARANFIPRHPQNGLRDGVKCVFGGHYPLGGFESDDNLFIDHQRHFPNCPGAHYMDASPAFGYMETLESRLESYTEHAKLIFQRKNIDYRHLAAAGYFYVGNQPGKDADSVQCYMDGEGVKRWDDNDVPWDEHRKLAPLCPLVLVHDSGQRVDQSGYGGTQQQYRSPSNVTVFENRDTVVSSRSTLQPQGRNMCLQAPSISIYIGGDAHFDPATRQTFLQQFSESGVVFGSESEPGYEPEREVYNIHHGNYVQHSIGTPSTVTEHRAPAPVGRNDLYTPRIRNDADFALLEQALINQGYTLQEAGDAINQWRRLQSSVPVDLEMLESTIRDMRRSFEQTNSPSTSTATVSSQVSLTEPSGASPVTPVVAVEQPLIDFTSESVASGSPAAVIELNIADRLLMLGVNQGSETMTEANGQPVADPFLGALESEVKVRSQEELDLMKVFLISESFSEERVDQLLTRMAGMAISMQTLRANIVLPAPAENQNAGAASSGGMAGQSTDKHKCKICLNKPLNMTFVPCGHLATCEECAPRLSTCPICRNNIQQRVRTYMS